MIGVEVAAVVAVGVGVRYWGKYVKDKAVSLGVVVGVRVDSGVKFLKIG